MSLLTAGTALPALAQTGEILPDGPVILGDDGLPVENAAAAPSVVFDEPLSDDPTLRTDGFGQRPVPVENVPTAPRAVRPIDLLDVNGRLRPIANVPAVPEQFGNGAATGDPYAPLGIRTGSFLWLPLLEQSVGYTSNASGVSGGDEAAFSLTRGEVTVVSDWALHELSARIGGSYQTFFDGEAEALPAFDADLRLRYDLSRQTTLTVGGAYDLRTESSTSFNLATGAVEETDRPDVHTVSGFAEAAHRVGRLGIALRGSAAHTTYGDLTLANGVDQSQGDRDATLALATLRLSLETGATLSPFVEGSYGARIYDEAVDRNGERRDSTIAALRAGFDLDAGEKLTGTFGIGYRTEEFDSASLGTLEGFTVDGRLVWSPVRLTTVTGRVETAFSPATQTGEAGSVAYAASLGVARQLRPNLSLSGLVRVAWQEDDAGRQDTTWQAQAELEWRLNRVAALFGAAGYETVDSTDPTADYDAAFARVGLRIRR